ncbi:hypothetical protein C2845_PM08G17140 [Panicum miliaceum]|uniref:At1g61320/AtMIF1 LRR domain-containing protein n=1 Tax=Panicum miliaceum TaxID=4540 RepID=A0A3L6R3B6_PANMI|nr:hypothetical protein C2845_PM08G17140 [Panicum miliaceum]
MQDASRQLLRSWRHYPELEFSARTLSLDGHHTCVRGQVAKDVIRRIDAALQNRTGICVKRLRFELQFLRKLLSSLRVRHCKVLQSVETDAPNLSIFHYQGPIIQFSLGEALHLKDVNMSVYPCFNLFHYVLKELPKLGPNLGTLSPPPEVISSPLAAETSSLRGRT